MRYFISEAHEYMFYLLELSGKQRMNKLGITPMCYRNKGRAKQWRDEVSKIINSDVAFHPDVLKEAESKLDEIYRNMTDY